ncbi:hypothetical protein UFOVP149_45 [uncultured Caudovirales phage]|uniref:Uncharacterized protein n=1 Tax=uncultured Caudovirales phage TaxID=2100421 RepID=A0A6J7WA55_9CAUD|nr:hypothetical protein UFOVP149_45 [uncultured Caudovirales phage]
MLKRDKVDLDLTSEDMNTLWGSVHATRDTSTTVKVDKATLTRLLMDHSKLLNVVLKH